ncbi:MAG: AAA family ATPase, partial [Patescibacteria group bacterium]
MFLTKLEIQGFKTFAKKTQLSFLPPTPSPLHPPSGRGETRYPVTAIVGPNGSGKSNLADAIRWVLGEQSLKLIRGKKSEDVIFSGSQGKGRAGFAEVSLTFNNEDHAMPIDYSEVTIVRRLYRDGTSEYLLNESQARLADIQLLLAQANVGQRSYSVIGQGMIDHVLVSSPEERKAFFDDATGVKPYQIKRHEAMLKLARTHENLRDVDLLLREIEPRLRSLKRQASRLEQREKIDSELHRLEAGYYGEQWWELSDQKKNAQDGFQKADHEVKQERAELVRLEKETERVEKAESGEDTELVKMQEAYRAEQKKRDALRSQEFETEKAIEMARVKAQSNWAPLPLLKIVQEIDEVVKGLKAVKVVKVIDEMLKAIDTLLHRSEKLSKNLQRPNPEDIKPDPILVGKLKDLRSQEEKLGKELTKMEVAIDAHMGKEKAARTELIETQ